MEARERTRKKTSVDFVRSTKLKGYLQHGRTSDPNVPVHRPVGPVVREPAEIPASTRLARSLPNHGRYVPVNFGPDDVTPAVRHTPPFFTSVIRRTTEPAENTPQVRQLPGSRPHWQGSVDHCLTHVSGAQSLAAIPGYTGFVRGKYSENVFGKIYCRDNEDSCTAVEGRGGRSTGVPTVTTIGDFKPAGYRTDLERAESVKRDRSDKEYGRITKKVRTWAANQPQLEREMSSWRRGIRKYAGHKPFWQEDKDFFSKMEVGKVHPVYCPKISHFSVLVQPSNVNTIPESARK